MKRIVILCLAMVLTLALCGQTDTLSIQSEIADVTVFLTGAQVKRVASPALKAGVSTLVFKRLPGELHTETIQVSRIPGCELIAVKQTVQSEKSLAKSSDLIAAENVVELRKRHIQAINNELKVYEIEEKILLDNSSLGSRTNAPSIGEIREAADFYRVRLNEIRSKKLALRASIDSAEKELQTAFSDLNRIIAEKGQYFSEINARFDCERATKGQVSLSYYVPSAGWQPTYDFRVEEVTQPMELVYRANVYQSSGEDWKAVTLTVSTGNPALSGERPTLEPWFLGAGQRSRQVVSDVQGSGSLKGKILDKETGEPLPFVNVVVKQGGEIAAGTASDFDGNFTIKPLPAGVFDMYVTYVGYNSQELRRIPISNGKITFQDVMLESGVQLDAFEVVEYTVPLIDKYGEASGGAIRSEEITRMPGRSAITGAANVQSNFDKVSMRSSREDDSYYYIDGIRVRGSSSVPRASIEYAYVDGIRVRGSSNMPESDLSHLGAQLVEELKRMDAAVQGVGHMEYVLPQKQDVRSDGQDYGMRIRSAEVMPGYVYHAIPKIERDVFLAAKLGGWGALDLLSGDATVYYKGTYTGETSIDAERTGDTLDISLGRERGIVVTRVGNRTLNDKRLAGSNIKEVVAWDLTVRNNKPHPITIILEDQFPVSERRSIQVDLVQNAGAKVEPRTGKLEWTLTLNPGEETVTTFAYEMKYPSGFFPGFK